MLMKSCATDVLTMLGTFLLAHNTDPNKMPLFDAAALEAAEHLERQRGRKSTAKAREKERMPDSDEDEDEDDMGEAGPGPMELRSHGALAEPGTQSLPKRVPSLPSQNRDVGSVEEGTGRLDQQGQEDFVTVDLARQMRRPITDAELEIIKKDPVLLQAVNVCKHSINVHIKHYVVNKELVRDSAKFSRFILMGALSGTTQTRRTCVDNSGLFMIPKPGKTTDVLRDMFTQKNGAGLHVRRAKMIFANPPWGVWQGNHDRPLPEGLIREFSQSFADILDTRGVVILEPGPNPTHHAAWVLAMDAAGFVQSRTPWLAECTGKRPRMLFHNSPPHASTPLYVFYRKTKNMSEKAPGMTWNKGVSSMVYQQDFHRDPVLNYTRMPKEKVKGVKGIRAQSNCLDLLAMLIQMYVECVVRLYQLYLGIGCSLVFSNLYFSHYTGTQYQMT